MVIAEESRRPTIIPGQGTTTVFVYGSLKHDQPNHHWLDGAIGLGERQLEGVQLFDLGPFPMAVAVELLPPTEARGQALQGELYRVNQITLRRLDRLEGTPRLFERHWLTLRHGEAAWVYLGRPSQVRHAPLLADGRWTGPRETRWLRPESPRLRRTR